VSDGARVVFFNTQSRPARGRW